MPVYLNGALSAPAFPTRYAAFAALAAQADTTITTAGTYYPIAGTFSNDPAVGFTAVSDPAIRYDGDVTKYFEIDWSATLSADDGLRTVHCGVKKNGGLVADSVMGTYLKTADEAQAMAGTAVVQLAKDDKIQLVVTSSANLDEITFYHYTTTIREFL